jgi:hypothetical protein
MCRLVVRLEGTNVERGKKIMAESGLDRSCRPNDLGDGAGKDRPKAVKEARSESCPILDQQEHQACMCQGITGAQGTFHSEQAIAYGTKHGRRRDPRQRRHDPASRPARLRHRGRGREARTGADASVIYVPPPFAADCDPGSHRRRIPLIICITEGIPVLDMVKRQALARPGRSPPG